MKNLRQRRSILAGSILAATLLSLHIGYSARAGSLTWDGSNFTNTQPDGGTGTWDANTTANWWNGTGNVVWPNTGTDNDAVFGNVAGTVTIDAGGVTANDLTFNTTGYVLSGAGTLTLNGTTPTVRLGSGISASIGAVLAGTNGLVKAGNGTLILNGSTANTLTGGVTVNGGTLNVNMGNFAAATNLVDASNTLTLGGGTLQVTGNATQVSSQAFANTVVTSGTSTIRATRGASNTVTIQVGTVTHTVGGVLNFVATEAIKNSPLSTTEFFRTTGLPTNATLGSWVFVNDSTSVDARWAQVIDGATGRIGTNSGTPATANMANVTDATKIYTVNGVNTPTASRAAFGIQAVNGDASYNLGSNTLTTDGFLSITAGITMTVTGSGGVVVGAGNDLVIAGAGNVTISAPISNKAGENSNVTFAGGGTLRLNTTAKTYTGLTTVNSGTVVLGLDNVLSSASGIVLNGGTLDVSTFSQSVASLKIGGGTIIGSGTLASASAIDAQNGTVNAILAGSGGLNKTTSGTVTLTAANTYTGSTNILGGRLELTGSLTSNIAVGPGATLGGEGATSGAVSFNGASTFVFDPTTGGAFTANTINATGATVTISPATSASGSDILIMQAPGGITGVPGTNFVFSGRGTPRLAAGNTQLLFDYAPGAVLWRGNDASLPTAWDVNTSTNWLNGANPDKYFNGDAVTFDDTASTFTVDVQPGGVLPGSVTFNNSTHTYTVQGGAISGLANLVKNGTGTLILANANTYSGTTTINAGTVQLSSNGAAAGSLGTGAITNNGAIEANMGSANGAIAGDISGTGTITQNGTGILSLTGTNTYDGLTTVNAGTLQVGSGGTTGTLGTNSVAVNTGATIAFNRSDDIIATNVISGAGGLKKSGAGTLTLGTSNTYSGTTTISGGAILLNATSGVLGDTTSGTVVNSGGALQLQGGLVFSGESLSLAGEGVNATTAAGALRSLSGDNEWASNITVLPAAITRVAVNAGSLKISGNIALSSTATDQFVLQGAGTGEISGVISGAGRVTKGSANSTTWVLSGANTYTGKTSISNGFLSVSSINSVVGGSASSNLGAPVDVASGTIDLGGNTASGGLKYTGSGETTDRVINLSGTTFSSTIDQSGTGLLKFTSDLTAVAGSKQFILQGSTTGSGEIAGAISNGSGTVALRKNGTGTWTLSGANTYTGATSITNGTLALGASGSLSGTSSININAGATFDVSALPGGFTAGPAQTVTGGVGATVGSITGKLIADTGSTIAPGPSAGGTGVLSVSNGFSLLSSAHLSLDLTGLTPGDGYDQVVVSSGNISLAGDLVGSTISLAPTNFTDVFYIIVNGGTGTTTGTLGGVAEGGTISIGAQQFQISYTSDFGGAGFAIGGTGNDVALLAVPEPGSIGILLGGVGLLAGLRRRRQAVLSK